ncbi:MAG TPA: DUF3696 domain-containing protein [Leptospiraceae bacterium]|nr:DUF3696 domain-containing protein [Leptospiraceae bacterium]
MKTWGLDPDGIRISLMINKISFKNYKLFRTLQEMELRPMTVLIGKNSSGKSAIAKLFTLIEGSLSGSFNEAFRLINGGVELGAEFKDLIHERKYGQLDFVISSDSESLETKIITFERHPPEIAEWKYHKGAASTELDGTSVFKGFNSKDYPFESISLNTDYIGPFRQLPERVYSSLNDSEKIGIYGENAYPILIKDGLTREKKLLSKVSQKYSENFEGWGLQINEDKTPYYQIELTRGNLHINIKDVGQGMSQALPLVVRAFMPTAEETLIIIEQPELHLHPGAHGNLAQIFAESLEDKNKRYLIETHSQNFVLRLRRLAAEGKLKREDLIIYYVDFDEEKNESSLKKIEVNSKGQVDFWPEGVFSETLDETIAIRTAQLKE